MRKTYDHTHQEPFGDFAASLAAGDTARIAPPVHTANGDLTCWLEQIGTLVSRGVIVRTEALPRFDDLLRTEPQTVEALAQLAVALSRRNQAAAGLAKPLPVALHKPKGLSRRAIEAHRLVVEEHLPVVEACRKAKIRPTAYYLNRNKIKHLF